MLLPPQGGNSHATPGAASLQTKLRLVVGLRLQA